MNILRKTLSNMARFLLFILLSISIVIAPPFAKKLLANTEKTLKTLIVKEKKLTVEVADTYEKRMTGLMFRKELGNNEGMLFIFEKPKRPSFWMKNTEIALSIAYIDEKGIILQIEDMKPHNLTPVEAKEKILYALEVNEGWFKDNGVKTGDIVKGLVESEVTLTK